MPVGLAALFRSLLGQCERFMGRRARSEQDWQDLGISTLITACREGVVAPDFVELDEAGEAVSAAARAVLARSVSLLPAPVHESAELAEEAVRSRSGRLEGLDRLTGFLSGRAGQEAFAGDERISEVEPIVRPRSPMILVRGWQSMQHRVPHESHRVQPPRLIRLEAALGRVVTNLKSRRRIRLSSLLRGQSRQDAVVHFLAVLELMRRQEVVAVQPDLFGDIAISAPESADASRARAG